MNPHKINTQKGLNWLKNKVWNDLGPREQNIVNDFDRFEVEKSAHEGTDHVRVTVYDKTGNSFEYILNSGKIQIIN